jgi:hypothetical protein
MANIGLTPYKENNWNRHKEVHFDVMEKYWA